MATKDIKNFTKYPSLSDNDYLLGTKTDLDGTDAGISVSDFKNQVSQDVKPTIVNGYWWVNGVNTGVKAEGQTPVFRYTDWGLEYKLEGQPDSAYQKLIPISDITFTWDDLTEEQKNELKGEQGLSSYQVWLSVEGNEGKTLDDYLLWLRQPATDAATEVLGQMEQIAEEASTAIQAANTAAQTANTASENVQDGKTPVLESVSAVSGETPSGSFSPNGTDEDGNPRYVLNLTLPKGDNGQPPVFEQGTTVTGEPETEASVEVVDNGFTPEGNPKYILNFIIPRGKQGIAGTGSGNVCADAAGLIAGKQYVFVPDANDSTTGTFVEYTEPEIDTTELVKINRAAIGDELKNEMGYGYQDAGWIKTGPVFQFGTSEYFKQVQGEGSSDRLFYRSVVGEKITGWKEFAFTSSNVDSADKLKTPRNINGTGFDGTADITIPNNYLDATIFFDADRNVLSLVTDELLSVLQKAYENRVNLLKLDMAYYPMTIRFSEGWYFINVTILSYDDHGLSLNCGVFKINSETKELIEESKTLPIATRTIAGYMSAEDKQKLDRQESYTNATTVENLNADFRYINVTLNENASLSVNLTGPEYNGRSVTAYVYCSSERTIAIPTTGNYVSMCGSSYTCPAGKWVEFNLECIDGKWHIAKLEQE